MYLVSFPRVEVPAEYLMVITVCVWACVCVRGRGWCRVGLPDRIELIRTCPSHTGHNITMCALS